MVVLVDSEGWYYRGSDFGVCFWGINKNLLGRLVIIKVILVRWGSLSIGMEMGKYKVCVWEGVSSLVWLEGIVVGF